MAQIARTVALVAGLAVCAVELCVADPAEKYPYYYAATRALGRGDCETAVKNLDAFLANNPEVREMYPDFHFQVRLVMKQCSDKASGTDTMRVTGIEEESLEMDPLPEHPPMEY